MTDYQIHTEALLRTQIELSSQILSELRKTSIEEERKNSQDILNEKVIELTKINQKYLMG